MVLTLEVVGEHAASLKGASRKVFDSIGGTIGRLPDNDWVFADAYVSGRHALIRYLNGKYFIEDTSTNGVFINSRDNRLSRSESRQLKHGDIVFIDAYQIRVSLEADPAAARRNDLLAAIRQDLTQQQSPRTERLPDEDRTASLAMKGAAADPDDGTQWFALGETPDRKEVSSEGMRPRAAPKSVPNNAPAARKAEPSPGRARSRSGRDDALAALLEAAGVEGLEPTQETARALGGVLRSAMSGVMEVLRARERMKSELRMPGTSLKSADNNPLKFSANVDDAFHNLFVRQNPAYLQPIEAVEDALRDARDHQTATLIAMRLAFEAMLARFDPDRMQDEFDRQMRKGSILGAPAKLRYWEMFRDQYAEFVRNANGAYQMLFAAEFARAYEEHIERLRSQRGK